MTDHGDLIQAAFILVICLLPCITVWVWMICSAIHDLADVARERRDDARARFRMRHWGLKGGR